MCTFNISVAEAAEAMEVAMVKDRLQTSKHLFTFIYYIMSGNKLNFLISKLY